MLAAPYANTQHAWHEDICIEDDHCALAGNQAQQPELQQTPTASQPEVYAHAFLNENQALGKKIGLTATWAAAPAIIVRADTVAAAGGVGKVSGSGKVWAPTDALSAVSVSSCMAPTLSQRP